MQILLHRYSVSNSAPAATLQSESHYDDVKNCFSLEHCCILAAAQ
jgi:hypothetical protein